MMMKNSLFLLISNALGRGPTKDDEEFSIFVVFKCFRKGVWGWGGGPLTMVKDSLFLVISNVHEGSPLMMMKGALFLPISNVLGRECVTVEGAH